MREIKFRGKRVDDGDWLYGSYISQNLVEGERSIRYWGGRNNCDLFEVPIDPATVGQFTGLKDKNGVEIYEGDILTREGCWPHMVCKWDGGAFKIDWFWMHREDMGMYEVIGNIHDNPELLEGGESK